MRSKVVPGVLILFPFLVSVATAPVVRAGADDACSLLTPAQVTAAVGITVGAGAYVTPTFKRTCTWSPEAAATATVKAVTLLVEPSNGYDQGKQLMQAAAARTTGPKAAQVSSASVGDDAYYLTMGDGVTSLMVKKGSVALKVSIYGALPTEKKKDAEKSLAQQAISKL